MQRAALLAVRMGCVGLGVWLSGCKDEAPPAIVDEDTIRWQMTSDIQPYKPHAAGENADFDVSCSISGETIDFTITAKPQEEAMIPRSVLSVTRANPGAGLCAVTMIEAPSPEAAEFTLTDKCKGTDAMGGCTLTGAFDSDGWDFNGTLTCTKLVQEESDTIFTKLYDTVANRGVVTIKLDNCD